MLMLFCFAAVSAFANSRDAADTGIPYKVLWHSYCLSRLSPEPADRLRITSNAGVSPLQFKFAPTDSAGYAPVTCDAEGVATVRWVPEFERNNTTISINQPKGSSSLTFGWRFDFDWNAPMPVEILINGKRHLEILFHFLVLQDLLSNSARGQ